MRKPTLEATLFASKRKARTPEELARKDFIKKIMVHVREKKDFQASISEAQEKLSLSKKSICAIVVQAFTFLSAGRNNEHKLWVVPCLRTLFFSPDRVMQEAVIKNIDVPEALARCLGFEAATEQESVANLISFFVKSWDLSTCRNVADALITKVQSEHYPFGSFLVQKQGVHALYELVSRNDPRKAMLIGIETTIPLLMKLAYSIDSEVRFQVFRLFNSLFGYFDGRQQILSYRGIILALCSFLDVGHIEMESMFPMGVQTLQKIVSTMVPNDVDELKRCLNEAVSRIESASIDPDQKTSIKEGLKYLFGTLEERLSEESSFVVGW